MGKYDENSFIPTFTSNFLSITYANSKVCETGVHVVNNDNGNP